MKTKLISLSLMVSYAAICGVSNASCLEGVLVGNVAGHMAHHHALAGAAVGFDQVRGKPRLQGGEG